jgi:hypothetical protein
MGTVDTEVEGGSDILPILPLPYLQDGRRKDFLMSKYLKIQAKNVPYVLNSCSSKALERYCQKSARFTKIKARSLPYKKGKTSTDSSQEEIEINTV